MRTEYVTTGEITAGKLKVRHRDLFERAMRQMKDGEVLVTVARHHATRSLAQNRYWWGRCLELVSERTGYTPEELHALAKQMFLPKTLALAKGNGELVGEFVIGGTTTTLNKIEFGEFVERFRQWAASMLDVVIPDPDPDYWDTSPSREVKHIERCDFS